MRERRRYVRVKPDAALPALAYRAVDSIVRETVDVVDISVGGMRLAMRPVAVGTQLTLDLALGSARETPIHVEVRWAAVGFLGVAFVNLSPEMSHVVQRYVGELLERGAAV